MSIKLQAAFRTVAMIAVAALGPIAVVALFQLDADTLFNLFVLTLGAWIVWVIYSINLSQLETEQQISEMQERRKTMISSIVKD
jgi:hypothetical protein